MKCTINVMCLNHPETIPPQPSVHGKIVFHETGPWCQKGWGLLVLTLVLLNYGYICACIRANHNYFYYGTILTLCKHTHCS